MVVWQRRPVDGKLVIPDTPAPARHQSGWLRGHTFQKSAQARAESGVNTRHTAAIGDIEDSLLRGDPELPLHRRGGIAAADKPVEFRLLALQLTA
jgi:hypothetical protein